jgi:hypothetical protein
MIHTSLLSTPSLLTNPVPPVQIHRNLFLSSSPTSLTPPLSNKPFSVLSLETTFKENLHQQIVHLKKQEKWASINTTTMKVLFISLLVLGVICASSFFLILGLKQIESAKVFLEKAKRIGEAFFIGGGILAGLSFVPRRFISNFENAQRLHQYKIKIYTKLSQESHLKFLETELHQKSHPEYLSKTSQLVELLYLLKTVENRTIDIQRIECQVSELQDLINKGNENNKKLLDIQIKKVQSHLNEMQNEIQKTSQKVSELRDQLTYLDREFVPKS